MADQYLKHEFRKIFHDLRNKNIWHQIDRSIDTYERRDGEGPFWNLVSSISENLKLKRVYHELSSTKYSWKLQSIPTNKLLLGGMSPTINRYTLKKCKRSPMLFLHEWNRNAKIRKVIHKTGFAKHPERDHFPIFVYKTKDGYAIFDGMRRSLLAIIENKKRIKAWVGTVTNPNGKSLISAGRCHFLANVYERSARFDPSLEKALVRIGKDIMHSYRNGRTTLINRIGGWTYDPKLKSIINKMKK